MNPDLDDPNPAGVAKDLLGVAKPEGAGNLEPGVLDTPAVDGGGILELGVAGNLLLGVLDSPWPNLLLGVDWRDPDITGLAKLLPSIQKSKYRRPFFFAISIIKMKDLNHPGVYIIYNLTTSKTKFSFLLKIVPQKFNCIRLKLVLFPRLFKNKPLKNTYGSFGGKVAALKPTLPM